MTANGLPDSKPTSSLDRRQGPSRRDIVAGSVTTDERSRILSAFEQAGFKTASEGIRILALAFTDSTVVRDTVARWRRQHFADAA